MSGHDGPNAAERVAVDRGAALLDEKRPGWWQQIEVDDDFRISSCGRCIAGQIGADHVDADIDAIELDLAGRCEFDVASYEAGLRVLGVTDDDAHLYGFDDTPGTGYAGLTAAWRELIEARRAVEAVTT